MILEDLLEQSLSERIMMLLENRPEHLKEMDLELLKRQEELLKNLDDETKARIEQLIDDLISACGEENRHLYLSGINDGIRIAKIVLKA